MTSQPAAVRDRRSDPALITAADDSIVRSRSRLHRARDAWRSAVPWTTRGRVAVHHAVSATGTSETIGYQRAMLAVRAAGLVVLFGAVPLYPIVDPPTLLLAGAILAGTIAVQASRLRGDRSIADWRHFAALALAADGVVAFLIGQAYIENQNWIAFLAYPLLAFEGAVFFGLRGAAVAATAIIAIYAAQANERAVLGHSLSVGHQVSVATIFAIQAGFVGLFARVTRRVRGDLAALLRLASLLAHQESPTRIVQALDAHLHALLGGRVRSVALRRPDGGYDVLRWRSTDVRVITAEAVRAVSRSIGRDIEQDFAERRAVTLAVTEAVGDPLAAALGLPDWVRSITLVPIHADGAHVGVLPILWDVPRVPGLDDLDLLHGLADQTGVAFAQAQLRRARELAATDSLTGLANHRAFQDLLAGHLADARRRGGRVSILFCDLDRFKSVNDRHGHAVGDVLLRDIAEAVRSAAREGDVVARYGGDEIALILPGTDRGGAVEAGRRLQDRVRGVEGAMGVDVTVGIAVYPDDATTQDGLLAHADAAMYAGKRLGGGRVIDGAGLASDA